jgi:hypothetical protein
MRAPVVAVALALSLIVLSAPSVAASGSTWSVQATPNPVPVDAVLGGVSCLTPSDCVAVGNYMTQSATETLTLVEHWDGIGWTVQSTPNPPATQSFLSGVSCLPDAGCVAVGFSLDDDWSRLQPLAERLVNGAWTLESVPVPAGARSARFDAVSCPGITTCTAVGFYADQSGNRQTLIEAWDGSDWRIQPSPNADSSYNDWLTGVSCPSTTSCEAVGFYYVLSGGTFYQRTLAEIWDGASWSIQPTANPAGSGNHLGAGLLSVSCPSTTTCLAVGTLSDDSSQHPVAEHWDGTQWTLDTLAGHSGGSELSGVSCVAVSSCIAVGYGMGTTMLRWDGGSWNLEAGPTTNTRTGYRGVSCVASCTAVGANVTDRGTTVTFAVGNGPVNPSPTATTMASSGNPSVWGSDLSLSATVTPTDGAGVPTGMVTFSEGSAILGQAGLTNGVATLAPASMSAGTHTITASYPGDSNNLASSGQLVESIKSVATTTTIASSGNPSVWGEHVKLSANVAPTEGAGIPTGTVTFSEGSAILGQAPVDKGVATMDTAGLSVGGHTVTASYDGNSDSLPSSGQLVESITSVTTAASLSSSSNPSQYGEAVTMAVSVASTVGTSVPTGTVAFTDGGTPLGTSQLSAGTATLSSSTLGVGTHSITATYSGDATHAGSSAQLVESITSVTTATSLSSSSNPSEYGEAVTMAVSVASTVGTSVPTGTVAFTDGGTPLGTSQLSAGTATLSSSTLGVGSHSVTATYSGDATHAASSAALSQTVQKAVTRLVATSAARINAVYSATLTRADNGAPVSGETVVFTVRRIVGSTNLCRAVTDANGVARCTTNPVPSEAPFATSYTATYGGSVNYEWSRATGAIP